jgi:DNA-binding XRE family transcriptional regulator
MTTGNYRAALNKFGLSIVASAEHLGLSHRQSQPYANGTSPFPDRVAKLLRVAIRLTATSVFSQRNSRRHRYLQLLTKTLYTLDSFFDAHRRVVRAISLVELMYSSHQQISSPEVVELRKEAGLWLKELREGRGLSQRQMAEKVGVNYYTFISQLESGRGRIPPDRYLVWAEALGVEPEFFVRNLLRSYDPVTYSILFGKSESQR